MRGKRLLAAFLLGVGLCFVPILGHGKIPHGAYEANVSLIEHLLLQCRVNYIMRNPTKFLDVSFFYDPEGDCARVWGLPEGVNTKGKIFVHIVDNRGIFSNRSKWGLLAGFKVTAEHVYGFIEPLATDVNTDIVIRWSSEENIPLGYFYQGQYYLWEK